MRCTPCFYILLIGVVSLFGSPAALSTTYDLELVKLDRPEDYFQTDGESVFTLVQPTPQVIDLLEDSDSFDLVKKEPDHYRFDQPYQGLVNLAGKDYLFAVDSTDFKAEGFDLLYFDRNGNGDLTDDGVVEAMSDGCTRPTDLDISARTRKFPRIDLLLGVASTSYEYGFFFSLTSVMRNEYLDCAEAQLRAGVYWKGRVVLNQTPCCFYLLDANSNGRFDDNIALRGSDSAGFFSPFSYEKSVSSSFPPISFSGLPREEYWNSIFIPGDLLFTDLRDKHDSLSVSQNEILQPGYHRVSELICFHETDYQFNVLPSGAQVEIELCKNKVGFLSIPCSGYSVYLYSLRGILQIKGEASTSYPLPAGEWRLLKYNLSDENTQSFLTAWGHDHCPSISIEEGQTTSWPFGPPLNPFVSNDQSYFDKCEVTDREFIRLNLEGRRAEQVSALISNGEDILLKSILTLTTHEGEVVKKIGFEKVRGLYRTPAILVNHEEGHHARVQLNGCPFPVNEDTWSSLPRTVFE